ncbi:MAG: hypothetical protein IKV27_05195 [Lachnospiraceae bacterium]|nr:hypothetical protein [Lachnospiraceae bacterium]
MSNFERKFGKYAVRNLSLVLIVCYVIGYVIQVAAPGIVSLLTLNPYAILHGQVWRLVTWVLIPPDSLDLFTIIMLFFYYSVGTSLERIWGTYRYNVYLFSGMLYTIIGSFLALLIYWLIARTMGTEVNPVVVQTASTLFSTYYINMSIFLAFAATFPDAQVLLMFVIPVKMKWMGVAYGVLLLIQLLGGVGSTVFNIFYRIALVASLLNFVIFWITSRGRLSMSPKQVKRRQEFHSEVKRNTHVIKHKCSICGRTDEDDPSLEFRFCSKCNGNYEYCQHHLFTHEHIK